MLGFRMVGLVGLGLVIALGAGCSSAGEEEESDLQQRSMALVVDKPKNDPLTNCMLDCLGGDGSTSNKDACMRGCFCKYGTEAEQNRIGVMCNLGSGADSKYQPDVPTTPPVSKLPTSGDLPKYQP